MALPVDDAAVAARTQRPEGGGGARQVQTDVPERVYRRGNAAGETQGFHMPLKGAKGTAPLSLWGALQVLGFKGFGISITPRGHSEMTENRAAPVFAHN